MLTSSSGSAAPVRAVWTPARALLLAAACVLAGPWPAAAQSPAGAGDLSMKGKTVMITGSTDGLGREVARRVAGLGAQVIVHGRNAARGKEVVDEITRAGHGSARFYAADLSSLDEVRTLAQAVLRDYPRLDVLVNNAGILLKDRQLNAAGQEMQFAVNYLSGFLLTRTLLPRIVNSAPARIINVASVAQSPIDFDDLTLAKPGRAGQGYGHSKLAQIVFTMDLARELQGRNVIVTALHPATMMDTNMVREAGMAARATVGEGADALMRLIVAPDVVSGQYYNGLAPARANAQAYEETAQARLREASLALTGPIGSR
jgi:NAD(P)-dependent dehydrogenase (short-subunit alcohol dehydrogenase family)